MKSVSEWNEIYKRGAHWEKGHLSQVKKFIKYLKKGAKILEIGCGSGRDSIFLAKKGFDVVGIDISAEAIKKAKAKSKGYSNLSLIRGRAEHLPFKTSSFDAVYSIWTLQFCPLKQAAKEIYRVLKKGGIAYLAFILSTERDGKVKHKIEKDKVLQTYKKFRLITSQEFRTKDKDERGFHWHENLILILKRNK